MKMHKKMGGVYTRPIWMVCRASYTWKTLVLAHADFGLRCEVADSLKGAVNCPTILGRVQRHVPGAECALLLRFGFKSYVTLLRHEKGARYDQVRWRRRLAIHCRAGQ